VTVDTGKEKDVASVSVADVGEGGRIEGMETTVDWTPVGVGV
jgi:hypothetical protein